MSYRRDLAAVATCAALVYLAMLPHVLWEKTAPLRHETLLPLSTWRGPHAQPALAPEIVTIDELVQRLESAEERDRIRGLQAARGAFDHAQHLLPQLESFLRSVHADERYWACFALGGLVPHSLDTLFAALAHPDARVRVAAAEGIEKAMRPFATDERLFQLDDPGDWLPGESHKRAVVTSTVRIRARGVPYLRRALADPADDVRMFTCMSLWKLGTRARAALPELARLRDDSSPAVRFWANAAIDRVAMNVRTILRSIGTRMRGSIEAETTLDAHAIEPLVRELDAPDVWARLTPSGYTWPSERDRRWEACRELLARWLPALEAREHAGSDGERRVARDLLARLEWCTMLHVERISRVLGNEWGVGMRAAQEHVTLGPGILPLLADDPFRAEHTRWASCIYAPSIWVLEELGDDALPLLAMGLEYPTAWARPWCAQAIFARGASAVPVIPAIVSAWRTLEDDPGGPGPGIYWDVEQIPFYGSSAWTDVPTQTVEGEPWTMKISDARALARLGASAIVPLVRALDDPHARVRARAAYALSAFETSLATRALPELERRLDDTCDSVRRAAAEACLVHAPAGSLAHVRAQALLDELPRK